MDLYSQGIRATTEVPGAIFHLDQIRGDGLFAGLEPPSPKISGQANVGVIVSAYITKNAERPCNVYTDTVLTRALSLWLPRSLARLARYKSGSEHGSGLYDLTWKWEYASGS
jgi:hypothetical protein